MNKAVKRGGAILLLIMIAIGIAAAYGKRTEGGWNTEFIEEFFQDCEEVIGREEYRYRIFQDTKDLYERSPETILLLYSKDGCGNIRKNKPECIFALADGQLKNTNYRLVAFEEEPDISGSGVCFRMVFCLADSGEEEPVLLLGRFRLAKGGLEAVAVEDGLLPHHSAFVCCNFFAPDRLFEMAVFETGSKSERVVAI